MRMQNPMVMHLQKLSVGAVSIEKLAAWQRRVADRRAGQGLPACHEHVTRMFPKQKEALLDGGSIYWVIKGNILCRNKIIGLEETRNGQGLKACSILMEPEPIAVSPTPRRAFQGWRYLKPEDAPEDLTQLSGGADLPPALRTKLFDIGAW